MVRSLRSVFASALAVLRLGRHRRRSRGNSDPDSTSTSASASALAPATDPAPTLSQARAIPLVGFEHNSTPLLIQSNNRIDNTLTFTPRASETPDLLFDLPPELHLLIFSHLSILDLIALRDACRTLARMIDRPLLQDALRAQNHDGWLMIFEFKGQYFPGTAYATRRLCGSCMRPKPISRMLTGATVAEYLSRRGVTKGRTWNLEEGMCFLCLWSTIVANGGDDLLKNTKDDDHGPGLSVRKRANIPPTEIFHMMDGSMRRSCENCAKDIHSNAVPCPYCTTDFGNWLRHKDCCSKGKPCKRQPVLLANACA